MAKAITENTLFYGDNLEILRDYLIDECVDLVYLDPPFNSNRNYNVLFKDEQGLESEAQIVAFEDTWHWGPETEHAYYHLITHGPDKVVGMITALRTFIGTNQMMAYLTMMAARLVELHRVLKPTGSLYLHCDPTASHYLKIILDTIFGPNMYANEIIWKRADTVKGNFGQGSKVWGTNTDTILFYRKSYSNTFNSSYEEYTEEYLKKYYRFVDADTGRRYRLVSMMGPGGAAKGNPQYEVMGVTRYWRYSKQKMQELIDAGMVVQTSPGTVPLHKLYLDDGKGVAIQSLWNDIPAMGATSGERLGYPTQKPLALLERIISASSNPGDIILDPFCIAPDTLIVTKTGVRPIQEVKIGDDVLTHTGKYQKVLKVYEREYDGTILNIERARSNVGIEITPNHPVLAVRSENCPYDTRRCLPRECHYHRSNRHLNCPNHKSQYQLEWIPAGELKLGDLVYYPTMEATPLERVLIPANNHFNTINIPKELPITPELMGWLGYFATEGFVDENSVHFANYEDAEYIADLGNQLFGLVGTVTLLDYRCKHVRFNSRPLSCWMEQTIGRGAANKHLPNWIFDTDATCRHALLSALLRSDGSFRKDKVDDASHSYRYASASPTLAHQVTRLLQMEQIASGFKKIWPTSQGKSLRGRKIKVNHYSYQVEVWDATSVNRLLSFTNESSPYNETIIRKPYDSYPLANGQLFSIKKIGQSQKATKVFNLEVDEDHSYVTTTFTVHNCGCGTAIAAAQKLDRKWIGIDITHLSIALQKYRLESMYPGITFKVIGEPEDIGAARQLAQDDRYQFQWWALSLIRAKPLGGMEGSKTGKKGRDKGIDGMINFVDDSTGKSKRVIVQVKSGHVKSGDIRDLVGTVGREDAAIGIFITLEPPTRDMRTEAASAGVYHSVGWGKDYSRIQILSIAELFQGADVKMPPQHGTFKSAQRVQKVTSEAQQVGFDFDEEEVEQR